MRHGRGAGGPETPVYSTWKCDLTKMAYINAFLEGSPENETSDTSETVDSDLGHGVVRGEVVWRNGEKVHENLKWQRETTLRQMKCRIHFRSTRVRVLNLLCSMDPEKPKTFPIHLNVKGYYRRSPELLQNKKGVNGYRTYFTNPRSRTFGLESRVS